ncbi:CinA family protein [Roseomonas sp. BN140053]|uniref:CinA family protein n=1 Tax=Roseomonas sp. BN140053 TaxID=3391898 RepID=UPI0039EA12F5
MSGEAVAARVAALLIARRHTVAVAESAAGGLVAARLLAVPGASAYFLGGGVIYTAAARSALLGITAEELTGMRPATEAYAALLAARVRERLGADWGLAETGAAGPSGNRYGDAAGHACVAVAGPTPLARTLETASPDRAANMDAFATAALESLEDALRR